MPINVDPPVGNLITELLMVAAWRPPGSRGELYPYSDVSPTTWVAPGQLFSYLLYNGPRCSQASDVLFEVALHGDFSPREGPDGLEDPLVLVLAVDHRTGRAALHDRNAEHALDHAAHGV